MSLRSFRSPACRNQYGFASVACFWLGKCHLPANMRIVKLRLVFRTDVLVGTMRIQPDVVWYPRQIAFLVFLLWQRFERQELRMMLNYSISLSEATLAAAWRHIPGWFRHLCLVLATHVWFLFKLYTWPAANMRIFKLRLVFRTDAPVGTMRMQHHVSWCSQQVVQLTDSEKMRKALAKWCQFFFD